MNAPRIALDPLRLLGFDQADRDAGLPDAKIGPKDFAPALRSKVGDKGPDPVLGANLQAKVGDKGPGPAVGASLQAKVGDKGPPPP